MKFIRATIIATLNLKICSISEFEVRDAFWRNKAILRSLFWRLCSRVRAGALPRAQGFLPHSKHHHSQMSLLRHSGNRINDVFDEFLGFPLSNTSNAWGRQNWAPEVDISENELQIGLDMNAPGFKKEDLEVDIDGNVLILKGKHSESQKENKDNFLRRERRSQSFERRFTLPEYADIEKIKAKMDSGVLHLDIPKKAHSKQEKSKQIQIL